MLSKKRIVCGNNKPLKRQKMSPHLPNSRLLGIQLTISTHSGPQVVYHYPPATVEHISERQRQRNQKSATLDDRLTNGVTEEIDKRNGSIVATLTGQSLRSNDNRTIGDGGNSSPNVESPLSSSLQNRESMIRDHLEENQSGQEQSSESESSGLSDSEISTDYADCSSLSSSSSDSLSDHNISSNNTHVENTNDDRINFEFHIPGTIGNSVNSRVSQNSRMLRSKSSQISAARLLDIFSKDTQNRRESRASKISTSLAALKDVDVEEQSEDDLELLAMLDSGEIYMDEQYFDNDFFVDTRKIFGFEIELVAEFCSPERSMCNTRFEFTIDQFCFLGLPIHVDADGNWRKSKKKRRSSNRSKRSGSMSAKDSRTHSHSSKERDKHMGHNTKKPVQKVQEEVEESNEKTTDKQTSHLKDSSDFIKDDLEKNMDMFHVCFIMNPPLVEYNERVDDMFHYVVARLSLFLRYAEAKSKYVSTQCNIILKERDNVVKFSKTYKAISGPAQRAKYLYQRILAKSSLARALTTCVEKIQKDEMACLEIGDDKVISLQIPIQSEFRVLPNIKLDPVLRGSYLTSILNSKFIEASSSRENENDGLFEKEEQDDSDDLLNYALILLDEPANIIGDLETLSSEDDIGNVILTHLIKHVQPSVPLRSYQHVINRLLGTTNENSGLGSQSSFETSMLRSCALHLIYQRHARVIIPVSSKGTYIVSPLAPIKGYSKNDFTSTVSYSVLNDKPLIYQNQEIFSRKFPSLPSLPSFLNLLSNGKPRTFGTIIPSKDHKPIYLKALVWLIRYGYVTQLLTFVCIRVDKQIKMAVEEDMEKEAPILFQSNTKRDHAVVDNVSKGRDNSVSGADALKTFQGVTSLNYQSEEEEETDYGYDDLNMERDYTIILEPERATAVEKRWIIKCVQDQPSDVRIVFNKVFKYFNGRTPMESIMIREGISRHELKKVIVSLDKYLIEFHHW
ncbi:hypothetical protein HG535_0E05600 [Zygotorulaspora mrakii]|uniref:Nitrogen permease regulator 3 n=1 Tax=Zygotorulaspora mrakii TaxID=42260 RepID=A0A7H9B522_ZYGMR|nr:uncharacterized protein HG535_0E05600 [Zygotorulaspora mrakii]QLG73476.1 hypothetical protein HG535_0E05600 [Zygotorulaspora mrakii]